MAENALHLETKTALARELESAQSDLHDQRATFKASLQTADSTIAQLSAQLRAMKVPASTDVSISSDCEATDGDAKLNDVDMVMILVSF